MIRRIRKLWQSGQKGQAMTETALLVFLIFVLGIASDWLLRSQSRSLNFIDIHIRGFSFTLSLPFP